MLIIIFLIFASLIVFAVNAFVRQFNLKRRTSVIITVAVALLLLGDDLMSFAYFKIKCGEAGSHLYSAESVYGFYAPGWNAEYVKKNLELGYAYIDTKNDSGDIIRNVSQSRYNSGNSIAVKFIVYPFEERLALGASRYGVRVKNMTNEKIYADTVRISTQGGYIYHFLWRLLADGAVSETCIGNISGPGNIITAALPPKMEH